MNPVKSSFGPLCNSVRDAKAYAETVFSNKVFELDSTVAPLHFNHETYERTRQSTSLRLGYLQYRGPDGELRYGMARLPLSRATSRMYEETLKKLEEKGHVLVPVEITMEEMVECYELYVSMTNFAELKNLMALEDKYEKIIPEYRKFTSFIKLPQWLKSVSIGVLKTFTHEERLV